MLGVPKFGTWSDTPWRPCGRLDVGFLDFAWMPWYPLLFRFFNSRYGGFLSCGIPSRHHGFEVTKSWSGWDLNDLRVLVASRRLGSIYISSSCSPHLEIHRSTSSYFTLSRIGPGGSTPPLKAQISMALGHRRGQNLALIWALESLS